MKGQRLFLRPIEPGDAPVVTTFLQQHAPDCPVPAWGVLAKLVGDVVAIAGLEPDGGALRITSVVVSPELRRKWIGRQVVAEIERLALKLELPAIVVEADENTAGFFLRSGFTASTTTNEMTRRVG